MADIRVVREKRRSMGWIWVVVLLLVLAAVAYWLWSTGRLNDMTGGRTPPPAAGTTGAAPSLPPSVASALHAPSRAA